MTDLDSLDRAAANLRAAEHAIERAHRIVDDLQRTLDSALRVLNDANLDACTHIPAQAQLATAAEHVCRLQDRIHDLPEQTNELYSHLTLASAAAANAQEHLAATEASDPNVSRDVAHLAGRLAVVGAMVPLAQPAIRQTARHLDHAQRACRRVTRATCWNPPRSPRNITTATTHLHRADEDTHLLETVVADAGRNAHQAADIAIEISDTARRRMTDHHRKPLPQAGHSGFGSPAIGATQ